MKKIKNNFTSMVGILLIVFFTFGCSESNEIEEINDTANTDLNSDINCLLLWLLSSTNLLIEISILLIWSLVASSIPFSFVRKLITVRMIK